MSDTLSVRELYQQIDGLFLDAFGQETWIHGEIRNYMVANSGHIYFNLADPDAEARNAPSLSITLFLPQQRGVNAALHAHGGGIELAEGVRVRISGRIGAYAPRSTLQMRMSGIDPTFTIGAIEQERERVLALMAAEGLLGVNGTLHVPDLPLRIALVTSVGSAAHADTLHELERWGVGFHILEIDARTQGAEAVDSLVRGLRTADSLDADVVLLVRGGGARTDLVAFDNEAVARQIVAMHTPVFTGVGHEIDRTVVDDVAHTAFKTPTACASAVGERARRCIDVFEDLAAAVPEVARAAVTAMADRVEERAARAARAAAGRLDHAALRLDHAATRTAPAARRTLDVAAARVELIEAKVAAHDPSLALARGWSLTRRSDGTVVRSVHDVAPGDEVTTLVADGLIVATVTGAQTAPTQEAPA